VTGKPVRRTPAGDDPADAARVGAVRAAGLIMAGLLAMLGIVLAVNLARYGTAGAILGVALLTLGAMGTALFFRGPRPQGR
jgi:hypothetical protein